MQGYRALLAELLSHACPLSSITHTLTVHIASAYNLCRHLHAALFVLSSCRFRTCTHTAVLQHVHLGHMQTTRKTTTPAPSAEKSQSPRSRNRLVRQLLTEVQAMASLKPTLTHPQARPKLAPPRPHLLRNLAARTERRHEMAPRAPARTLQRRRRLGPKMLASGGRLNFLQISSPRTHPANRAAAPADPMT